MVCCSYINSRYSFYRVIHHFFRRETYYDVPRVLPLFISFSYICTITLTYPTLLICILFSPSIQILKYLLLGYRKKTKFSSSVKISKVLQSPPFTFACILSLSLKSHLSPSLIFSSSLEILLFLSMLLFSMFHQTSAQHTDSPTLMETAYPSLSWTHLTLSLCQTHPSGKAWISRWKYCNILASTEARKLKKFEQSGVTVSPLEQFPIRSLDKESIKYQIE